MAISQTVANLASGTPVAPGSGAFIPIFGAGLAVNATEARAQGVIRDSITFTRLQVRCTTAPTGTDVFRFRVGAANGNESVSVTGTGLTTDTTNSDARSSGNAVNTGYTISTGSPKYSAIKYSLGNATTSLLGGGTLIPSGVLATYHICVGKGGGASVTTESQTQYMLNVSSTLSNLFMNANGVPGTGSKTWRTRINGNNGNQSVAVSTAAQYEDTTNTDGVVSGSQINYVCGGNINTGSQILLVTMKSTAQVRQLGASGVAQLITISVTDYVGIGEDMALLTTTETNTQVEAGLSTTFSNLFALATAIVGSESATIRDRKNTANGSMSVVLSAVGWALDTTNTTSFTTTDLMDFSIVTDALGTSITIKIVGCDCGAAPTAMAPLPYQPWGQRGPILAQ